MKIFRIRNRRNSLATNSSSTHSVVYKNKDQVFEDLGIFDNRYYDRCTETIAASREAKIRYIFANIFHCEDLVKLMSMRYPEMKEYYPLVKEHYDIYCNEDKITAIQEAHKDDAEYNYFRAWDELEEYQFGEHCRGNLYNEKELHLSYEYLCNIIDSPDIVIVGGSDEMEFVYDKTENCKELSNEYTYMNSITEKIKNGNYYVLYGTKWDRKEKVRLQVDSIPDMIPEFPELVDMKITDACEHKCPFCYMASTPNGKHADPIDVYSIIRKFKNKTEFALGGGNVLLHPNFADIVRVIDHNHKHIANITIRYDDIETINNNNDIKNAIKRHVSGIGISVQKESDVDFAKEFIYEMLGLGKHISLHLIPEMIGVNESIAILNKMEEINLYIRDMIKSKEYEYTNNVYDINTCKALFLGLKQAGRAKKLDHNLLTSDDVTALQKAARYHFNVDTAFINTYSDWFKLNYFDSEELFLTRHEGEYSMFIDAVKKKAYTSSYKDDGGIDIDEKDKIENIFGEIRKKNGFKVFEKPVPYYC